ncbi:MAG TPA: biotin transporter BioY [Candidatus Polarisedimenticolia bacterium]|jgi:biotin transport system substrate-specific component
MEKTTELVAARVHPAVRKLAVCALFAALIAAGGHLRVPIPGNPVPLTLQVVFVLLAGALLAPSTAAASVALFLLAGLAGAPVFSGSGAGLAYLMGPTGGYLVGFLLGAALCSFILRARRDSFALVVVSMAACVLTIHFFGAARLAIYLGGDIRLAVRLGIMPFIGMDVLKILAAAAVVTGTSSLMPKGPAAGTL